MLTDEVLSRLSQLNRTRLPLVVAEPAAAVPAVPSLDIAEQDSAGADVSQLPAGTEVSNAWGKHWLRERNLSEIWPHGEQWLSRERVRLDHIHQAGGPSATDLQAFLTHLPGGVLLLDLETCGFAGSPIFLAGLIHEQQGQWVLSQLLARHYAEEKSLLQTLWTIAAEKRVLVTFNGKSFDWPMVHDRSTLHHLGQDPRDALAAGSAQGEPAAALPPLQRHDRRPSLRHCDLLHHARRRWGRQLPDCRLQTLERHLCRRQRSEDIPGREIPAAYHDFVRDGDAWLMRGVLHHNALDLITLLQVAMLAVQ
ncbi:MAG: ribonuclease H-like domain-containing protein [Pirellulaceae bacterium]